MRRGVDRQPRLSRLPCHARRRARRAPLAVACSTVPLQPRQRRTQNQQAAHQAAQCCTGKQRRPWRCGAASLSCPRSRHTAARPSTSCRRRAPPSGSTRCSHSTCSFAQRSARATPRRADPQSAQEAACGRPGRCPLASSAAMSSARASEQRKSGGGCHALRNAHLFGVHFCGFRVHFCGFRVHLPVAYLPATTVPARWTAGQLWR